MVAQSHIDNLYLRYIKPLPAEARLRLLAVMAADLAETPALPRPPERSLLELEGLGADIWQGVDAQTYVDQLRAEWDQRP